MRDVHWCVAVDYQQIANGNVANQIHGFTIDYGKFILKPVIAKAPTILRTLLYLSNNVENFPTPGERVMPPLILSTLLYFNVYKLDITELDNMFIIYHKFLLAYHL